MFPCNRWWQFPLVVEALPDALHIADKENKKAIIMWEGCFPFIALDFLFEEGEFTLSLVLSLN